MGILTLQMVFLPIAAAAEQIQRVSGGLSGIDFTVLLSIITISIGAMGTLVAIYGRKAKRSDTPCDENLYCKNKKRDMERIAEDVKENTSENKEMRLIVHQIELTLQEAVTNNQNMKLSIEEMKQNRKEFIRQLEVLIAQLSFYLQD